MDAHCAPPPPAHMLPKHVSPLIPHTVTQPVTARVILMFFAKHWFEGLGGAQLEKNLGHFCLISQRFHMETLQIESPLRVCDA